MRKIGLRMKITTLLIILVILIFSNKYLILEAIVIYQVYISPNKGWECPYGLLHPNDSSCSEYGKLMIQKFGVIKGLNMLMVRFDECSHSSYTLDSLSNTTIYIK